MPVRGDFSALREHIERVSKLTDGKGVVKAVSDATKPVALALARRSWSERSSPNGGGWKPRVDGSNATLSVSGRLKAALRVEDRPGGFAVVDTAVSLKGGRYAGTHQYGRTYRRGEHKWRVPARPFLPRKRTLPRIWAIELEAAALEAFSKRVK